MENRRKEPRKKLMAFILVYDSQRGTVLGYLSDLTTQGALVVGEHALQTDSRLILAIEFPGDLEGITTPQMAIPARVARCVSDESPNNYQIGFEFIEVNPEQTKMIQALLDRYHFRHKNVITG